MATLGFVNEPADVIAMRKKGMIANARDRLTNGFVEIFECAERIRWLCTGSREDFSAERWFIRPVQSAIRVMHEDDLPRLQDALRENERP